MSSKSPVSGDNLSKIIMKNFSKIFGLRFKFKMPLKKLRKVLYITLRLNNFQIVEIFFTNIS